MGFTGKQQALFRPLVSRAWERHALGSRLNPSDKALRDAWYRAELMKAIGVDSTRGCNVGRDFEAVMAHFKAGGGGDMGWNLRKELDGDLRRWRWSIKQLCKKWSIDNDYARATAARILQWPGNLESLAEIKNAVDMRKVYIALVIHARRHGKREQQAAKQANTRPSKRQPVPQSGNCPF